MDGVNYLMGKTEVLEVQIHVPEFHIYTYTYMYTYSYIEGEDTNMQRNIQMPPVCRKFKKCL